MVNEYNYHENVDSPDDQSSKNLLNSIHTNNNKLYDQLKGYNLSSPDISEINIDMKENTHAENNVIDYISTQANATENNLESASNNLVNQIVINDILETQMQNANAEYTNLKQDNTEKLRMVEINTYYTQRYQAHVELMKTIIFVCIPLLLILILTNKEILPARVGYILGGIILVIGIVLIGLKIFDLSIRNNMDYNEYDQVYYQVKEDPKGHVAMPDIGQELEQEFHSSISALEKNLGFACIDGKCCGAGTTYNSILGQCEISKSN